MQANPRGGWSRAEPHKWADTCSDGGADTSSECCQSASEQLRIENVQLRKLEEKLKKQIREKSGKSCDLEGDPPLPSRQTRSREFKAKKEGGLEIVEAKGKKDKGDKAGQQRAPR